MKKQIINKINSLMGYTYINQPEYYTIKDLKQLYENLKNGKSKK